MPSQAVIRAAILSIRRPAGRIGAVLAGIAALGGAALLSARTPETDAFALGRDSNGEPCGIARNWHDDRLASPFDRAWTITCRGVSAARAQGWLIAVRPGGKGRDKGSAEPTVDACGPPKPVRLEPTGDAEARACFDARLGLPVVRLRVERGGVIYTGAALATALAPLEGALRAVSGAGAAPDADASAKPSIVPATLAQPQPATGATAAARLAGGGGVDPAAVLQAGISLNHRGQYIEASRLLNDVLSRLSGTASSPVRSDLELEAALADSNIGQFDAADDHFARADALLDKSAALDRVAYLRAKQSTYRGQDAINRRQFAAALVLLGQASSVSDPLGDPAMLSALNQPSAGGGVRAAVTGTNSVQLARLLLEAQRSWARSVATLSLGDVPGARRALDEGLVSVDQLQRAVSPESVSALKARVQRQYGRLAARDGRLPQAIHAFDCALATLHNLPVRDGGACVLDLPRPRDRLFLRAGRSGFVGTGGPMVAETELERASLLVRLPGVDRAQVLHDFADATDAMIASGASGTAVPAAMEVYLRLLATADAASPSPENEERFFRAVQAIGEPSVARQVAQLQRVVTADGPAAAKVRDRAELERVVIRLRYEIAAAPAAGVDALETQRLVAEGKLAEVDAALAGDPRFRVTDDTPVTIAALRAALRPGEAYLKVIQLRALAFGVTIDAKRVKIYALAAPADIVSAIAARVRGSIRDDSGRLPFFDVSAAYALFDLLAGPGAPVLMEAKALVIDPSGPLANLPAGVLVTDLASVKRYAQTRGTAPNDLSGVSFLAARAELTGALSPRSFLIARALSPSRAPDPFIGFGQNAPAAQLPPAQAAMQVAFGTGCEVSYGELATIMDANQPVSATEVRLAASALGVAGAPEVTGTAFTDRAVIAASGRGDLARYQVLHFATHGLPETRSGCVRVPPALVTTLAPPERGQTPSDGLLSFSEIAGLRLDANLVVLSACETASGVSGVGGRLGGQDESGATLDGLVRAFVTANARAVLATYWKVPAVQSSNEFIRDFYEHGRTETIGGALRDAQTAAIARPATSHPYFWGAYFLVGDGAKSMLSPTVSPAKVAAR